LADVAAARSARAYVWGQQDKLDQALAEFDEIEPMNPNSAWLHYRRALCYVAANKQRPAISNLRRALQCNSPKLNPPRKHHAITLLQEYGVTVE